MGFPTDHHWALRGWLRSKGVDTYEFERTLIARDLDGLLNVSGCPRRLTRDEQELVESARARREGEPSSDVERLLGRYFGMGAFPDGYVSRVQAKLDEYQEVFPECSQEDLLHLVGNSEGLPERTHAWLQDPFGSRVHALLAEVCDELGEVGVSARHGLGLGVTMGDEILAAQVEITDTARLYELMADDGYRAKPDQLAPTFRERPWPDEQSAVLRCGACGEPVDLDGVDKYGSDHCGANDDVHDPEPSADKAEET